MNLNIPSEFVEFPYWVLNTISFQSKNWHTSRCIPIFLRKPIGHTILSFPHNSALVTLKSWMVTTGRIKDGLGHHNRITVVTQRLSILEKCVCICGFSDAFRWMFLRHNYICLDAFSPLGKWTKAHVLGTCLMEINSLLLSLPCIALNCSICLYFLS